MHSVTRLEDWTCLFLNEFKLLRFEKLFRNALRVLLTTQAERPKFFAELGGILIQESSELDLECLDIRLSTSISISNRRDPPRPSM